MKVSCPVCGAAVAGADIDLANSRAVCRSCSEVFPLTGHAPLARPADLRATVERTATSIRLVLTPSRLGGLALGAFASVWCAFLVFWYSTALRHPTAGHIMLWFPLLHVGVGIFMSWIALRQLFNSTTIRLDQNGLAIDEGPIPSFAALGERAEAIVRFEVGRRAKRSFNSGSGGRERAVLLVVTRDGRSIPAPFALDCDEHARWLAAMLDETLAAIAAPAVPLTYRG